LRATASLCPYTLDAAWLPLVVLEASAVRLSPSFAEQKKILQHVVVYRPRGPSAIWPSEGHELVRTFNRGRLNACSKSFPNGLSGRHKYKAVERAQFRRKLASFGCAAA
jgi:hypothetical protein